MKPIYLKVLSSPKASIDIRHEISSYFKNPLHFHPEYELTLILDSSGTQFTGNSIRPFFKNELTLTGPNLPHYWRCDPIYYQNVNGLKAEAIIVRFPEEFLGKEFFQLPEMQQVKKLLRKSLQGLNYYGSTKDITAEIIYAMLEMDGAERIISLLKVLNTLSRSSEYRILSSMGFTQHYRVFDVDRINKVYSYVMENFMRPIHLNEVAAVANMNIAAFCRYFKGKSGKTFCQFLQEIRIGYACKLLIDGSYNVSQVGYECGFQNQSYFIKQFRKETLLTPLQYQNRFKTAFL